MGGSSGYICRRCGEHFVVRGGGGFYFDELHCDACGRVTSVLHRDLGDIHLRFVKGLPGPYAVSRSEMDRQIQAEYPGEPLGRDEYHAAVEATLEPCECGGRFRYDAPPAARPVVLLRSSGRTTRPPQACSMTDATPHFKRMTEAARPSSRATTR